MKIRIVRLFLTLCLSGCLTPVTQEPSLAWDSSFFPLVEGNVWVYRQTSRREEKESEAIRVKTAFPHRDGLWLLQDPDGDPCLLSSDPDGLRVHGEIKPDGKELAFRPPFAYVTRELLTKGQIEEVHLAEDRTINSKSRLLGERDIDLPVLGGKARALVTEFEYQGPDGQKSSVTHHFVRGVGTALRTIHLESKEGHHLLQSDDVLLAARVGGRVFPENDPSLLAKLAYRHAINHREGWGPGFPGFSARVTLIVDQAPIGTYRVNVEAKGEATRITSEKEASADHDSWTRRTIRSMIGHRRGGSSESQDATTEFKLVPSRPGALGIEIVGDEMSSRFEALAGAIRLLSRMDEGGRRFQVDVKDVLWTPRRRSLATRFVTTYYEKDQRPSLVEEVSDEYVEKGSYSLPSRRRVKTGDLVRELRFDEIELK